MLPIVVIGIIYLRIKKSAPLQIRIYENYFSTLQRLEECTLIKQRHSILNNLFLKSLILRPYNIDVP